MLLALRRAAAIHGLPDSNIAADRMSLENCGPVGCKLREAAQQLDRTPPQHCKGTEYEYTINLSIQQAALAHVNSIDASWTGRRLNPAQVQTITLNMQGCISICS
jgi:hypothetical protein